MVKTKRKLSYNQLTKTSQLHLDMLSRDDFHLMLNVERSRADRSQSFFSLVLFDCTSHRPEKVKVFVGTLKRRMRTVDIAGWFDDNIIGVILFGTKREGAAVFVESLKEIPAVVVPTQLLFSYPGNWYGEEDLEFSNFFDKEAGQESFTNDRRSKENRAKIRQILVRKMPVWKRVMDIIGALIGIILLSPLFLLVAGLIKIVSRGPVFFKQDRVGYKGKRFTLYKFRTMHQDNNQGFHQNHFKDFFHSNKPMEKLDGKKDPRIIPCGTLLRKSCIDELPQLINVLLGDMSLVGPRPCIPYEASEYKRWHHGRFDIVPGMTGLWQVSGKNKLSFNEMVRLDITYSRKVSFLFDLIILLRTVPTILSLLVEKTMPKTVKTEKEKCPEYEPFKWN